MWDNTLAELAIPSDALNKLLKLYDEENVLKTNFMKKNGLRSYVSLSQYGYDNIEAYRDSLKSYTSQIVKEDQRKQVSEFNVANTFDLDPSYETCMLTKEIRKQCYSISLLISYYGMVLRRLQILCVQTDSILRLKLPSPQKYLGIIEMAMARKPCSTIHE